MFKTNLLHGTSVCPLGPPCGPICTNERVESRLREVKPQIQTLKEKLNMVSPSVGVMPLGHTAVLLSDGPLITGITLNTTAPDSNTFRFPWQVSMWVQLQIPKIEDGNNFGVAIQVGSRW